MEQHIFVSTEYWLHIFILRRLSRFLFRKNIFRKSERKYKIVDRWGDRKPGVLSSPMAIVYNVSVTTLYDFEDWLIILRIIAVYWCIDSNTNGVDLVPLSCYHFSKRVYDTLFGFDTKCFYQVTNMTLTNTCVSLTLIRFNPYLSYQAAKRGKMSGTTFGHWSWVVWDSMRCKSFLTR